MNDMVDLSEIAFAFLARNLSKIIRMAQSIYGTIKAEMRIRLKLAYENYIKNMGQKYGRAKSFFIRDEPTSIYDFYVPLGITYGENALEKADIESIAKLTRRVVISASAGSGKSMFLRHLLLDSLNNSDQIPVFIELRNIQDENNSIMQSIYVALQQFGFDLDETYIEKAIEFGHFVFLFDGYDEISTQKRLRISRQIIELSRRAGDCMVIVSSRPDDAFAGWEDFRELKIAPLNVDGACELVEKLPFDDDIKSKFVSDLRSFLFNRHASFLSNPLLLSIMLLTYGNNADIPTKLSLFFDQAYEALFHRHDARKPGGFKRERVSALDIQDFSRVFSVFCLQAYHYRKFDFTRKEALEYINGAKKIVSINVDNNAYLSDCLQSVNLLVEDGIKLVFSHRSFQEYFVALYINEAEPRVQKDLLNRYLRFIQIDNVYGLLYEINPGLIEREIFSTNIRKILDDLGIKSIVGITHFYRFLSKYYSMVYIEKDMCGIQPKNIRNQGRQNLVQNLALIGFIHSCWVKHSKSIIDEKSIKPTRKKDSLENFTKKYLDNSRSEFRLDQLSYRSELIKDMFRMDMFRFVRQLNGALSYQKMLEKKLETTPELLEELLA